MSQFYDDPRREDDEHALPNCEVFYRTDKENFEDGWVDEDDGEPMSAGWYYWPCFPGCLPDGYPIGPFDTEAEAIADARENSGCEDDL